MRVILSLVASRAEYHVQQKHPDLESTEYDPIIETNRSFVGGCHGRVSVVVR